MCKEKDAEHPYLEMLQMKSGKVQCPIQFVLRVFQLLQYTQTQATPFQKLLRKGFIKSDDGLDARSSLNAKRQQKERGVQVKFRSSHFTITSLYLVSSVGL